MQWQYLPALNVICSMTDYLNSSFLKNSGLVKMGQ